MKIKQWLIEKLQGKERAQLLQKMLEEQEGRKGNLYPPIGDNGETNILLDFRNWNGPNDMVLAVGGAPMSATVDTRLSVRPIDVSKELEVAPTPFTLLYLDQKIKLLKSKQGLTNHYYVSRELSGLIERLENRTKYADFAEFFEKFPYTTEEKIDALTKKYKLVVRDASLFIPEFPEEAIAAMTQYKEKVQELCGKDPTFVVIATEDSFKKAYQKRDPILLVQSPFSFSYQILGSWDKEMLIVTEL